MTAEELAALRHRLMNAVVVASMPDVTSLTPIEDEPGVFTLDFANGKEVFVTLTPA